MQTNANVVSTMNSSLAEATNTLTMSTDDGIPAGTPTVTFNPRSYSGSIDFVENHMQNMHMGDHTYAQRINNTSTVNTVGSIVSQPTNSLSSRPDTSSHLNQTSTDLTRNM